MRTLLVALLWSCDSKNGDSASATDDSTQGGDDSAAGDLDGDGVAAPADCDDTDDSIHPGADETIADGIDQDCDGNDLCYADGDGDGFGSAKTAAAPTCDDKGVASTSTDCDDADVAIQPGGAEVPVDAIDQDCDGGDLCFADSDGDGFGTSVAVASTDLDCADAGEADDADDCLDVGKDALVTFPGAASIDSDTECMTDADDDGYGSPTPAKGVTAGTDCDDSDSAPCGEFHVGNDKEFPDGSSHWADYLLGFQLDVKTAMTVTDLALIGKASGANVRMALYSGDSGPDALLVETPSTPVPVGVLEIPVDPTFIEPGSYWITAVYDVTASIGVDKTGGVYQYRSLPFADPMPDPFGTVSTEEGAVFNYYIVGY